MDFVTPTVAAIELAQLGEQLSSLRLRPPKLLRELERSLARHGQLVAVVCSRHAGDADAGRGDDRGRRGAGVACHADPARVGATPRDRWRLTCPPTAGSRRTGLRCGRTASAESRRICLPPQPVLHEGFFASLSHAERSLYFCLVLAGDRNGVSFYASTLTTRSATRSS
jgi:hypothetical protein